MKAKRLMLLLLGCLAVAFASPAVDFERAMSLPKRTQNTVFRATIKPNWLPDGQSFWYRVRTGSQSYEFVLINAATGARKTAGSLKALGLPEEKDVKTSTLTVEARPTRRTGEESGLKFVNQLATDVELFWINEQGEHVRYSRVRAGSEREQHTHDGHVWLITTGKGEPIAVVEAKATIQTIIIDGHGAKAEAPQPRPAGRGVRSPDGRWSVTIDNGRVTLRETATGKASPLKTDLDGKSPFHGRAAWAPDSQTFVVSSCVEVPTRRIRIVESMPKGHLEPKLIELDYAKPGDPLPKPFPVIFRLKDGGHEWVRVPGDLFPDPFTTDTQVDVRWSKDVGEFYFAYNQRGHQLYRLLAVNAQTGAVRVVVEETSPTFIDYTKKTWRHWLDQTAELIWMSERDGWCHLWLYDVKTGAVKNQITRGAWPVREVLHVDEAKREVWFYASGLRAQEDPYHKHLCRVNFDGSGFKQLTEGDGQHTVDFSPTREFFLDSWSRVDQPPVHELRRSVDGSLVCEVEKADASKLLATGWTMPERFVAKGRDGRTDIHGILIKPSNFDPAKNYPVVEDIYAGPHSAFTPKEFDRLVNLHQMAELGFIVVKLDGMGTNHRGKAFHDVCWKNLKDAGFPDRIAWIKAAAQTRPWMDLSRVGIYGGSAGGQSAMRALLDHHEFYKVAVADCGCHDNRMDKIWWNEQWMGWPVDESYARSSNKEDAHKLQGHLLLIVGELDRNVDPASTTQVVGALQRAGKAFEFLPIVGAGHGAAGTPYGSRAQMEFLVKHLRP